MSRLRAANTKRARVLTHAARAVLELDNVEAHTLQCLRVCPGCDDRAVVFATDLNLREAEALASLEHPVARW